MTARERAEELRRLHEAPELLVLPNVWDAASARTVAGLSECRALATPSWGIAAAHGVEDGALGAEAMVEAVGRICAAVEMPVTADLEDGYGDAGATVAAAIDAGAVGCNIEDGCGDPAEHAGRVRAARAAGEGAGVPVVINARTDLYLHRDPDLDDAIARGRLYLEAGADCVFVPGAHRPQDLSALGTSFDGRLSVMAWPGWDAGRLSALAELGVARVTFGPGLMGAAYAYLQATAQSLLDLEAPPEAMSFRPPTA